MFDGPINVFKGICWRIYQCQSRLIASHPFPKDWLKGADFTAIDVFTDNSVELLRKDPDSPQFETAHQFSWDCCSGPVVLNFKNIQGMGV